jgi:hypothetical protein
MNDPFWFLVQTRYPDPRLSYHLGYSTDGDKTATSICASKPLVRSLAKRGSVDEPKVWMCRRCIAEAKRRAA